MDENSDERIGASPGTARPADEYIERSQEVAHIGADIARMKPAPELSSSAKGMPKVMRVLLEADGPMSPSEIARASGVTDARIANTLRVLEQKGFITRETAEHDRRRVEVRVTEKGREVSRRHIEKAQEMLASFLCEMGEQDARDLVRVLRRARDVMAKRRAEGRAIEPPKRF